MVATWEMSRPIRKAARPRRPDSVSLWPPGARAILDLSPRGCRWPLGEVHEETFGFCNAPQARGSYCERHGRAARTGAQR